MLVLLAAVLVVLWGALGARQGGVFEARWGADAAQWTIVMCTISHSANSKAGGRAAYRSAAECTTLHALTMRLCAGAPRRQSGSAFTFGMRAGAPRRQCGSASIVVFVSSTKEATTAQRAPPPALKAPRGTGARHVAESGHG